MWYVSEQLLLTLKFTSGKFEMSRATNYLQSIIC